MSEEEREKREKKREERREKREEEKDRLEIGELPLLEIPEDEIIEMGVGRV